MLQSPRPMAVLGAMMPANSDQTVSTGNICKSEPKVFSKVLKIFPHGFRKRPREIDFHRFVLNVINHKQKKIIKSIFKI